MWQGVCLKRRFLTNLPTSKFDELIILKKVSARSVCDSDYLQYNKDDQPLRVYEAKATTAAGVATPMVKTWFKNIVYNML